MDTGIRFAYSPDAHRLAEILFNWHAGDHPPIKFYMVRLLQVIKKSMKCLMMYLEMGRDLLVSQQLL